MVERTAITSLCVWRLRRLAGAHGRSEGTQANGPIRAGNRSPGLRGDVFATAICHRGDDRDNGDGSPTTGVGNGVDRSQWRCGRRSCGDDLELWMDRRIHLECAANSVRFFGARRFSALSPSIAFTISNSGARGLHLLRTGLGTCSDWNVSLGRGGFSRLDGDRVWRHMRRADPVAKNAASRRGSPPADWLRICPSWNHNLYGITQSLEYS